MNDELKEYIIDQLQQGVSEDDIRDTLVKEGWNVEDITFSFSRVDEKGGSENEDKSISGKKTHSNYFKILGKVLIYIIVFIILGFLILGSYLWFNYGGFYRDMQTGVKDAMTQYSPVGDEELFDIGDVSLDSSGEEEIIGESVYLHANANPSIFTLASSTPYKSVWEDSYHGITIDAVPAGYFVDEELGLKIRLPNSFSEYRVEKSRYTKGSDWDIDGNTLVKKGEFSYTIEFLVDTTEVEWSKGSKKPFGVFQIGVEPVTIWQGLGGKVTDEKRVVGVKNIPGDMYLAETDYHLYTINQVSIICPTRYKDEYKNKTLPTPHCAVHDAVFTEIADTFKLIDSDNKKPSSVMRGNFP